MKRFLILLLLTVPATADDLARSVEMMAKVGAAYAPSFSPDAERLAYITNISGSPQVWIVPSAGGYPQQVTAFNDPVTGMSWSPDGTWIAVQIAPGGGLNSQIYILRPDGRDVRLLTAGGKENNWLGRWTPDSKSLVIGSNSSRIAVAMSRRSTARSSRSGPTGTAWPRLCRPTSASPGATARRGSSSRPPARPTTSDRASCRW